MLKVENQTLEGGKMPSIIQLVCLPRPQLLGD